jgi:hypothetical protein
VGWAVQFAADGADVQPVDDPFAVDLSFDWKYKQDDADQGRNAGWQAPDLDDSEWETVSRRYSLDTSRGRLPCPMRVKFIFAGGARARILWE